MSPLMSVGGAHKDRGVSNGDQAEYAILNSHPSSQHSETWNLALFPSNEFDTLGLVNCDLGYLGLIPSSTPDLP